MIDIMKQGLGQARPNKTAFVKQRTPQWGFQAAERSALARWRGPAPTSSCGRTARNGKQAKAGYHRGDGILPFALHPLYCAFRVNRCVRPYMAGTHVRRKKGRFLHIGVFFRLSVWYTRFSSTNRNLQDGETYGRIDTKMFMGNYRLI